MDQNERQLVQLIAEQVLAVLRQREAQARGDANPNQLSTRASVRPPIGVCTGDYSLFPELAGRQVGAVPAEAPSSAPVSPATPLALSGIITASQLQAAIEASSDGVATVAHDARLTPLASDFVRQHPQKIRRVPGSAPGNSASATGATAPWLWWMQGHCPIAAKLTAARAGLMVQSGGANHAAALPQVIREIANGLRTRRITGAVLFVDDPAAALCYANRSSVIRAVIAHDGAALGRGIEQIGANVLVIDYKHTNEPNMTQLLDVMLQSQPRAAAAVERELADLHRT